MRTKVEILREIANNPDLIREAHRALEDLLIDLRDSRISLINRGNGLCVREKDGTMSSMIRISTDDAVRLGIEAIADHLEKQQ